MTTPVGVFFSDGNLDRGFFYVSFLSIKTVTIFNIPPPLPIFSLTYLIVLINPSLIPNWTPPTGKIFGGWRFLDGTPLIGSTPNTIYVPGDTYDYTNICALAPNWIDPPADNICLPRGTPVTVDGGRTVPIEQLQPGTHTLNKGRRIVAISQTRHQTNYLVCFEPHALGVNVPSRRTVMSHTHRVLYQGYWRPANDFLGAFSNASVKKVPYEGDILYNVLLDKYDSMTVNNMTLETLNPTSEMARSLLKK